MSKKIIEKYLSEKINIDYCEPGKEKTLPQKILRAIKDIPFENLSLENLSINGIDKKIIAEEMLKLIYNTIQCNENGLIGRHNKNLESDYDEKEVNSGINVEYEHLNNWIPLDIANKIATAIALDHLSEDKQYYTKLKKYIEK